MALSVVDAGASGATAPIDWAAVQIAQFDHDEKYHREISRLTVQDRLRHMSLHFAKYAGRLWEENGDDERQKTVIDSLIIAVSTANILNINLATASIPASSNCGDTTFARRLSVAAGRFAGACERLDHLEDVPYRKILSAEMLAILGACLDAARAEGWCPVSEMRDRLRPIKAKSIFFGKL